MRHHNTASLRTYFRTNSSSNRLQDNIIFISSNPKGRQSFVSYALEVHNVVLEVLRPVGGVGLVERVDLEKNGGGHARSVCGRGGGAGFVQRRQAQRSGPTMGDQQGKTTTRRILRRRVGSSSCEVSQRLLLWIALRGATLFSVLSRIVQAELRHTQHLDAGPTCRVSPCPAWGPGCWGGS